jgi:glucuronokinase
VTTVQRARGAALARAALAGNPSDGYGGAVLAVTLPAWRARAEAFPAAEFESDPPNFLVEATVRRFARELEPAGLATSIRWSTSIPQQVGLGSSSALVIAVIRALCDLHRVELGSGELAELALAVESEDLGIVAGLQDRVAQAYEGLTFMDFGGTGTGAGGSSYEPLDPGLLPPLLIAWRSEAAGHSGQIHSSLHTRHRDGEPLVYETMASLAQAARDARDALLGGDLERFCGCVDRTFDLRRRVVELDPLCVEMVEGARACGASANYTGSGGAIVAACSDPDGLDAVARALDGIGCGVTRA